MGSSGIASHLTIIEDCFPINFFGCYPNSASPTPQNDYIESNRCANTQKTWQLIYYQQVKRFFIENRRPAFWQLNVSVFYKYVLIGGHFLTINY